MQNFAVSSRSDKKELAWEFIKTLFSSDIYRNNTGLIYGIPIIKSELEYTAIESMKPKKILTPIMTD
ncbi:MAG: hypothetical protein PUA51_02180 [Oscillospiraceae bacterium]|nr:hypothetical protein [Oscillospiraceae bacterium]